MTRWQLALPSMLVAQIVAAPALGANGPGLRISWAANMLTIEAPGLPDGKLTVNYLEAYCRGGSTDRNWGQTVIKHATRLVRASPDGHELALECRLTDGVVVEHKIVAEGGAVDFRLSAHNPRETASEAHWAQPCIRVGEFTGRTQQTYLPQCFILVGGKVAHLPTEPWATKARYVPGQVYCPANVDRNDVNPRPLSEIVPSGGLIGCVSLDGQWVMGSAWEPYQELFQGVIACVHSDFRIGGLEPGETKQIRGKIYLMRDKIESLVARYERDFPEHLGASK
ncbi:MAG: hypothetical protein HY288_10785 [Planctomycetia bacterium]|nr:hypothetical protein [Planctomycetia bacterium]